MNEQTLKDYSFFDPKLQQEPFDFYRKLRSEAPVFWSDELNCFVVSKNKLIREVLDDWETFSSVDANSGFIVNDEVRDKILELRAKGYPQVPFLATNDPPTHTSYRKVFAAVFSARHIAVMQPDIERIVADLMQPLLDHGGGEFMSAFAVPLPLMVMANMLGVPLDRVNDYKDWTTAYVEPLGGMLSPEREVECAQLTLDYQRFFEEEIEKRRKEPRDDVLTQLIEFELPDEQRRLDTAELLAAVQQFLVAGGETTTFTIGNGLRLMAENPDIVEIIRTDDKKLRAFIEEVLRMRSPSQGLYRIVKKDTEIDGVPIPKGSIVNVRIGAGNRDEDAIAHPDQLDINREKPSQHLSFGVGLHFCIGAPLARSEIFAAYRRLLDHVDRITIDEAAGGFDYFHSVFFHGMSHLHVQFEGSRKAQ